MTDEDVKPTPLRHHLLFSGLIVGPVAIIPIFFTRYPMTCQIGYTLASGGGSTVCVRSGTAKMMSGLGHLPACDDSESREGP